jgi:hypothetical protein
VNVFAVKTHTQKAYRRATAQQSRNQIVSSLRPSAYLGALCDEISVIAEDRRDTQRAAEKIFSAKKTMRAKPRYRLGP